jgi:hypothetical protein
MKYHLNKRLSIPACVCIFILLSGSGMCKEAVAVNEPAELTAAQAKGLYTVLILHRNDGQDVLESGVKEALAGRLDVFVYSSAVTSPSLAATLRQFKMDVETLPTPLAMVISSNNVVTGIFTRVPKSEKLKEALLPEQPLAVRKMLSDGKAVLIKAQSRTTIGNIETDKAISEYLGDKRISNKVVVLPVDLDKIENAPFLKQLKIDPPNEKQSVLICLAPPLKIVNKAFRGAATKDIIVTASSAACGTGCATGKS